MNKKWMTLSAICLVLLFSACGGKPEPVVELPEDSINEIQETYEQLQEAAAAFRQLDAGVLQIVSEQTQRHIESGSGQANEYVEKTEDTIRFRKTDQGYDLIRISRSEGQDVPTGYKQENGILTLYNYRAHEDGTFEWKEAAAEKNHYRLPEEADLFVHLTDQKLIREIRVEHRDGMTVYELIPGGAFFDARASLSAYKGYALDTYQISYCVDEQHLLRKVILSQTESWTHTEIYDVEQTRVVEIELDSVQDETDLDYFRNNGTYVRPVYDEITEIWREEFINIPETYLFDVRIPRVREELPNANKINDRIAADCEMELNATLADLTSQGDWGGYPWHTVDFEVCRFGDIYQICIFNTEASAWGSGVSMWMYKYYYDASLGDEIKPEDFLAHMNYTPREIEEIFYRDYLFESPDPDGEFTYDQISDWFYIDEDANVRFYVNLYG